MVSIPPREETQGCFVLLVELLVSCPTIQSPIREEEYSITALYTAISLFRVSKP